MSQNETSPTWVNVTEASRRSRLSRLYVTTLGLSGEIRTLVRRGVPPQFALEDVLQAARLKGRLAS